MINYFQNLSYFKQSKMDFSEICDNQNAKIFTTNDSRIIFHNEELVDFYNEIFFSLSEDPDVNDYMIQKEKEKCEFKQNDRILTIS